MKKFIEDRSDKSKEQTQDKLTELKKEMNGIINALYEDISNFAFGMDKYRVPISGIKNADKENPLNLF
jgi:hypothetical protein